jgi:hypothetical protein
MLFCGRDWQPSLVKRVIETYETSTRVAKVATDAGNGFLKGMGNPAGSLALASEVVVGELAVWLGLRVPPFAIVGTGDIQIPMMGRGDMLPGPAFISQEIEGTAGSTTPTTCPRWLSLTHGFGTRILARRIPARHPTIVITSFSHRWGENSIWSPWITPTALLRQHSKTSWEKPIYWLTRRCTATIRNLPR